MSSIVLFASTSGIAQAVAEEFLKRKESILLIARNQEQLELQARDLEVKYGVSVPTLQWDLKDSETHEEKAHQLFEQYAVKGLFMAAGWMPPQEECEQDPTKTIQTIHCNFAAVSAILNLFAEHFAQKGTGFISCISSVAGDRGRGSNYIYGASKAGLTAYLEGMRNRFHKQGILIQTVKPGPVKTAMTAHLKDSALMAEPHDVACDIVRAIEARKDIVYTPFFWKYIMTAIKCVPDPLFKRMSL